MLKILTIFGTRPEAIKLASVIRAIRRHSACLDCSVCVTGQHRDLLDQVLVPFGIRPDFDLDLMTPGQSFVRLVPAMLQGLDTVFSEVRPDAVIVQGDTDSAFCGALTAWRQRVPVGHVEAGLRSGNRDQPFPEEVNRRLIAQLAEWHFAPTIAARSNLLAEGIDEYRIVLTGNTVADALDLVAERGGSGDGCPSDVLAKVILITAHRRESFGDPLARICRAVEQLASEFPSNRFVFPVHPNPQVRETAHRILVGIPNVELIEPLEYIAFVQLMRRSALILTDSGGVQEEAPYLGIPVLVLREESDRPESILAGNARLVGSDTVRIVAETRRLLTDETHYRQMSMRRELYGDGRAGERIAEFLRANVVSAEIGASESPVGCRNFSSSESVVLSVDA